jgi:hypothetical protein
MNFSSTQPSVQVKLPLSKWCLWLGLSSLILGIFTGLPAIVCGHVAFARLKKDSNIYTGKGLALTGIVLGYLSTAFSIGYIGLFIYSGYPITSIISR